MAVNNNFEEVSTVEVKIVMQRTLGQLLVVRLVL